jgi:hypothetical protein
MRDPIPFTYQGRDLESRATKTENGWTVRVWEGDRKVTRRSYSVSDDTGEDMTAYGFNDIVAVFLEMAKDEVLNGMVPLLP